MWLATDNLHQEEVDVIINENGDALCYYNRRLNSYNNIEPSIHLFESKDLAEKWLTDYKETLREKMSECRRFVDLMMNIQTSEDFDFKREDFLGSVAQSLSYHEELGDYYEHVIRILGKVAKKRILSIAGSSFLLENVKDIEWHDNDSATVKGEDFHVTSVSQAEYDALCYLFKDYHHMFGEDS